MLTSRQKKREFYYLLPGMGGSHYRRKQRRILQWAIVVGLWISALFGLLLYFINRPLSGL
ncbi:MAG: hypothetical protein NZ739_09545 [Verrucomicrobiae bacterium]|nr:hypothetical protein [Verrucomicrobiae bacterium]MCX7721975.1 hypothetical protein [Verrucomicrobiae bacterium]